MAGTSVPALFDMGRLAFTLIVFFFSLSCSTTKFQKGLSCRICLETDELILVEIVIPELLVWQEERLREIVRKEFGRVGKYRIGFKDDFDYEMLAMNIKRHELGKLHQHLGVSYLLTIGLKKVSPSEGFDMLEADKANSLYPSPRIPLHSSSLVELSLVEAKSSEEVFRLKLVSNSQEMSHTGSDGSLYFVDLGTIFGTMAAGVRRGTKYIIADCVCPKGAYVKKSKFLNWL